MCKRDMVRVLLLWALCFCLCLTACAPGAADPMQGTAAAGEENNTLLEENGSVAPPDEGGESVVQDEPLAQDPDQAATENSSDEGMGGGDESDSLFLAKVDLFTHLQEIVGEELNVQEEYEKNKWDYLTPVYIEGCTDQIPILCQMIRRLGIKKEEFIAADAKERERLHALTLRSNHPEMSDEEWEEEFQLYQGIANCYYEEILFSAEEIDVLFSQDDAMIREYFKAPWTISHEGKLYGARWFVQQDVQAWKELGLSPEILQEAFDLAAENTNYPHSRAYETLMEKMEEYEKMVERKPEP